MKIKIITTGGTIDKVYFDAKSEYEVGPPQVANLLSEANVAFTYEIESVLRKDSLDMTEADRRLIRERVAGDAAERIIVTHGTDTMAETARLIGAVGLAKTIVITGAMVPYQVQGSDALFNFGTAFMAAQLLPIGVYIVMNGRIFGWDKVRKDRSRGVFEEV